MRIAMILGLALVTGAVAQDVRTVREVRTQQVVTTDAPNFVELSRQLSNGSDALRLQLDRGEPQSDKLGKRILSNILGGGQDRRGAHDPVIREFDEATRDLVSAAKELERGRERGRGGYESERHFIRSFRSVERLSGEVDRDLTAPTARNIFTTQISPALTNIRAQLPTLAAFRDHEERREDRYMRRSSRE